ncbi:hypothetical protein TELCIR_12742 [Teladorsagia circumcincta]|uniref:Uncharacterized protein n=1 Tax=Teladorsagia circumcincta TaxID=45464 RepID=A0A2G9U7U7_TELCI|nr:hypothetical protein TELCIR_12742 [Teladorsagia circumcincta]
MPILEKTVRTAIERTGDVVDDDDGRSALLTVAVQSASDRKSLSRGEMFLIRLAVLGDIEAKSAIEMHYGENCKGMMLSALRGTGPTSREEMSGVFYTAVVAQQLDTLVPIACAISSELPISVSTCAITFVQASPNDLIHLQAHVQFAGYKTRATLRVSEGKRIGKQDGTSSSQEDDHNSAASTHHPKKDSEARPKRETSSSEESGHNSTGSTHHPPKASETKTKRALSSFKDDELNAAESAYSL